MYFLVTCLLWVSSVAGVHYIPALVEPVPVVLEVLVQPKVVLCAIQMYENPYIGEWLQYHQFLGFDLAEVHDNEPTPSQHLLDLEKKFGGFLKVTHTPGIALQIPVYRNCTEKYRHNNTWIAIVDIDEFIVLKNHTNIHDFLQQVAPRGGSVVLNWSIVCGTTEKQEPGPILARFNRTGPALNHHVKTIVYAKHAKKSWVHNTVLLPGAPSVDGKGNGTDVDPQSPFRPHMKREEVLAYISHFHTKSFDEFLKKKMRGDADALVQPLSQLTDAERMNIIVRKFQGHSAECDVEDLNAYNFFVHNLKSHARIE